MLILINLTNISRNTSHLVYLRCRIVLRVDKRTEGQTDALQRLMQPPRAGCIITNKKQSPPQCGTLIEDGRTILVHANLMDEAPYRAALYTLYTYGTGPGYRAALYLNCTGPRSLFRHLLFFTTAICCHSGSKMTE